MTPEEHKGLTVKEMELYISNWLSEDKVQYESYEMIANHMGRDEVVVKVLYNIIQQAYETGLDKGLAIQEKFKLESIH